MEDDLSVIVHVDKAESSRVGRFRHRKKSRLPIISAVIFVACFAGVATLMLKLEASSGPPRFASADDLHAVENRAVGQQLKLIDADRWEGAVTFELVQGPPGATVDPGSGVFSWKPNAGTKTRREQVTVRVRSNDDQQAADTVSFWVTVVRSNRKPVIQLPEDLQVVVGDTLQTTLEALDPDSPPAPLLFTLAKGPPGAVLDPNTGKLTWTPPAETASGSALFLVRLREDQEGGLSIAAAFRVQVVRPETPIDKTVAALRDCGLTGRIGSEEFEHSFAGTGAVLRIGGEEIRFFEYPSERAVREDVLKIAKDRTSLQMPDLPESWVGPALYFRKGLALYVYAGLNQDLLEELTKILGEPLPTGTVRSTESSIPSLEQSPP